MTPIFQVNAVPNLFLEFLARIPFLHPFRQFFQNHIPVIFGNSFGQLRFSGFIIRFPDRIDRLVFIAGMNAKFIANLLLRTLAPVNFQNFLRAHPLRKLPIFWRKFMGTPALFHEPLISGLGGA